MSILTNPSFTKPDGFKFAHFQRNNRNLRYGFIALKSPKAFVIALPGLGEYVEKYYETARDITKAGYGFIVIDWFGQGASGRHLNNPLKRHSDGFEHDIQDLHTLITQELPAITKNVPLIMLSHSMGGNIGLRYLTAYPNIFACAGFSAPMCGIKDISKLPRFFQLALSSALNLIAGKHFVSRKGDFSLGQRMDFDNNALSNDPIRFQLHHSWFEKDENLRIGDVTFGWVYHAIRSCLTLTAEAKHIKTPCLFALAGQDSIVDNAATQAVIQHIKDTKTVKFDNAKHEVLMEIDDVRAAFFTAFFTLISNSLTQK